MVTPKSMLEELLDACQDTGEATFPFDLKKGQPVIGFDKVNHKTLVLDVRSFTKKQRFPSVEVDEVLEDVHTAGQMAAGLVLAPFLEAAWVLPWHGYHNVSDWLIPEGETLTHFVRRKLYPRAPAPIVKVRPADPEVEIVENEADHVKVRHGHLAYEIRDGQLWGGLAGASGKVMVEIHKGQIPAELYPWLREFGRDLGLRLKGR